MSEYVAKCSVGLMIDEASRPTSYGQSRVFLELPQF